MLRWTRAWTLPIGGSALQFQLLQTAYRTQQYRVRAPEPRSVKGVPWEAVPAPPPRLPYPPSLSQLAPFPPLGPSQAAHFPCRLRPTSHPRSSRQTGAASYKLLDGEAASPPLVFLHGLFGSKANFNSIAKALAQQTGREGELLESAGP